MTIVVCQEITLKIYEINILVLQFICAEIVWTSISLQYFWWTCITLSDILVQQHSNRYLTLFPLVFYSIWYIMFRLLWSNYCHWSLSPESGVGSTLFLCQLFFVCSSSHGIVEPSTAMSRKQRLKTCLTTDVWVIFSNGHWNLAVDASMRRLP